jgi:hypothetical protein
MADIYLMKIRVTYESHPVGPGAKPFGKKAAGPKERRLMFDYKLLIYATSAIAGIVYEIKLARTPISPQRISTVSVEKKLGKTRMHAGIHQTVVELIKTMEDDEVMQFMDVQDQVKNRRLACGEMISPCTCLTGIRITPVISVKAVIHIIEFPARISPLLGETTTDEFHIFVEKLMSDALLPSAKMNFNVMSARKRHSLYQELYWVTPSPRRTILSSKSEMRGVIGRIAVDPIEQHLGALLGQLRVLLEELKLFVVQVCEVADVRFEGAHALNRWTKREILEWIGKNWDASSETFTTIATNQRTLSGRSRG